MFLQLRYDRRSTGRTPRVARKGPRGVRAQDVQDFLLTPFLLSSPRSFSLSFPRDLRTPVLFSPFRLSDRKCITVCADGTNAIAGRDRSGAERARHHIHEENILKGTRLWTDYGGSPLSPRSGDVTRSRRTTSRRRRRRRLPGIQNSSCPARQIERNASLGVSENRGWRTGEGWRNVTRKPTISAVHLGTFRSLIGNGYMYLTIGKWTRQDPSNGTSHSSRDRFSLGNRNEMLSSSGIFLRVIVLGGCFKFKEMRRIYRFISQLNNR